MVTFALLQSSMEVLPFFILCYIFILSLFAEISFAADTLGVNQSISDAQTLVSSDQRFELGFFSPGNSRNRYLGIWFKNIQPTFVWVANRNNPITDSSGVLKISSDGNLVLLNAIEEVVWSSNSSRAGVKPVAQLLQSGNFVVRDESRNGDSGSFTWQSFDYPCDTLLPGMKLGWNLKANRNWSFTSWKNQNDPATGEFTYIVDHRGLPQIVLREGNVIQYRSDPWDGIRFGGEPVLKSNAVFEPIFIYNNDEVYYTYKNNQRSTLSRFVLNPSGSIQHFTWNYKRQEWVSILTLQKDNCDSYARCGAYGTCNIDDSQACKCLKGFIPKSPQDWNSFDPSAGCIRRFPLDCKGGEGFMKFTRLKLPDKSQFLVNNGSTDCAKECLASCSCMAYAITDISNCVVWLDDLIDIREYTRGRMELYIKMTAMELAANHEGKHDVRIILVLVALGILLFGGSISWFIIWKKRNPTAENNINDQEGDCRDEAGHQEGSIDLHIFDFITIAAATNDFSFTCKIGEGGFGPVYKGQLSTGQEIAVKRLAKGSGQGLNEFKNEVSLIAKLQHRNLVRLLGCCIQGAERMLIYEYMTNKSLDTFIFDEARCTSLHWQKRFDIIVGIARGLLYLHQDSRLRIIHRDLKASNILLDNEMNPKISDFGAARTFGIDQTEGNTRRVIGTYGYMSPEYAIDGLFSVKSDVYSFGVLVLEIISGRKNRGFFHPQHDLNLLGHVWKLWNDGKPMELTDPSMENPYPLPTSQVLKCIHVGLLCVQQRPEDRPIMSTVVLMLGSDNANLPQPKQPGFSTERFPTDKDSSSSDNKTFTAGNDVTVTAIQGR